MRLFSYRAAGATNRGVFYKGPLDKPSFIIDFADGIAAGDSIALQSVTAVDSSNSSTSNLVDTCSTSGSQLTVNLKTGGASGTGAATDGARFKISATVTLTTSPARTLYYLVFVTVRNKTYGPT